MNYSLESKSSVICYEDRKHFLTPYFVWWIPLSGGVMLICVHAQ